MTIFKTTSNHLSSQLDNETGGPCDFSTCYFRTLNGLKMAGNRNEFPCLLMKIAFKLWFVHFHLCNRNCFVFFESADWTVKVLCYFTQTCIVQSQNDFYWLERAFDTRFKQWRPPVTQISVIKEFFEKALHKPIFCSLNN